MAIENETQCSRENTKMALSQIARAAGEISPGVREAEWEKPKRGRS